VIMLVSKAESIMYSLHKSVRGLGWHAPATECAAHVTLSAAANPQRFSMCAQPSRNGIRT
jgi:hypothetical protein